MPAIHRPVLLDEVLEWLDPKPGMTVLDATVGAGGHAAEIAERVGPAGHVVGLDRDPTMLEHAREATSGRPVTLVRSAYDRIAAVLDGLGLDRVDGIVADLGFASDQMDTADRGFSFQREGPLDMRYDPSQPLTAAEVVNRYDPSALADAFRELGGEPRARVIAERIAEARRESPIETTGRLARLVREVYGARRQKTDPATRVFQALRLLVNEELAILDRLLEAAPDRLRPGGRFVVISFHSLEDERVKSCFRDDERLRVVTKKPVVAGDREVRRNPRSRSAKLRAADRV